MDATLLDLSKLGNKMTRNNGKKPQDRQTPRPDAAHIPAMIRHIEPGLTMTADGLPFMVRDSDGVLRHCGHLDVHTIDGKVWQLITGPAEATDRVVKQIMNLWQMQLQADGDLEETV